MTIRVFDVCINRPVDFTYDDTYEVNEKTTYLDIQEMIEDSIETDTKDWIEVEVTSFNYEEVRA